jgi:hypothetical protein
MRTYAIRVNNGRDSGPAIVVEPDMSHAFERARELALRERAKGRRTTAADDARRAEEALPAG